LGSNALALVLLLVAMLGASLLVAKPASAQGNLQSWGYNLSGQLGNGTNTNSKQPVDVQGNLGALKSVEGGGHHTLAVKSDGTVWAWGTNDFGALGDGTTTSSNTPVQVQGLTDVKTVAAGFGSLRPVGRRNTNSQEQAGLRENVPRRNPKWNPDRRYRRLAQPDGETVESSQESPIRRRGAGLPLLPHC
jgi:hypothetical protein